MTQRVCPQMKMFKACDATIPCFLLLLTIQTERLTSEDDTTTRFASISKCFFHVADGDWEVNYSFHRPAAS